MPKNVYVPAALEQRMQDAEKLSAQRGLGKINWSELARAVFERECARRERAFEGAPSAEDVDVEKIAERSRRGYEESHQVAFAAALELAGAMDEDDIYFLGAFDDSANGFEAETGLSFIDPDHGYPRSEFNLWLDEITHHRDALLAPVIEAAHRHADEEGLRFQHDNAQAGAMEALAGVCDRLREHTSAQIAGHWDATPPQS